MALAAGPENFVVTGSEIINLFLGSIVIGFAFSLPTFIYEREDIALPFQVIFQMGIGMIVLFVVAIFLIILFSKYFYVASITSYFQFYVIDKFGLTEIQAQVYLFYFLLAVAIGTLLGGIFGDRFGRKYVIWFSVLGAAPFTLLLPYANLTFTAVLIVIIGLIISSAFPAILVYAQELLPKKIGMVSGLFYGFAFGMGGLGSAVLGWLADETSINYIYSICSFLPLIGIIAAFLPNMKKVGTKSA